MLTEIIKQNEAEFDEKFAEDKSGKNSVGVQYIDAPETKLKSFLLSSQLKLVEEIKKEVEGIDISEITYGAFRRKVLSLLSQVLKDNEQKV